MVSIFRYNETYILSGMRARVLQSMPSCDPSMVSRFMENAAERETQRPSAIVRSLEELLADTTSKPSTIASHSMDDVRVRRLCLLCV